MDVKMGLTFKTRQLEYLKLTEMSAYLKIMVLRILWPSEVQLFSWEMLFMANK